MPRINTYTEQKRIMKALVGKRIDHVELNTFNDSGKTMFDPEVVFEDGSFLSFNVDVGENEYGVSLYLGREHEMEPADNAGMVEAAKLVVLESMRSGRYTSGDDSYSSLVRSAVRYLKTMAPDEWATIEQLLLRQSR